MAGPSSGAWRPAQPIVSGNAYRHWFDDVDQPLPARAQRWLRPFLVTAESDEDLRSRVDGFVAAVGSDDCIRLPTPRPGAPHAVAVFVPAFAEADLSQLSGVTGNSMPLPRSGTGGREAPLLAFDAERIERIVAVIDAEIAFAHRRFCDARGTRIAWFWDQDADAFDGPDRFGRELDAGAIDAYRARFAGSPGGEAALYAAYRRDSYCDPTAALPPSRFAHGTGVLDAAVGGEVLETDDGLAIFAVQLPGFAVGQTQGHFLEVYLRLALDRVATLADRIGAERADGRRPAVYVNVSVGGHAGRHDGGSRLERQMDEMIAKDEVKAIFLPAGNSREKRVHARFRTGDLRESAEPLLWRVLPDDGTPSFLEIWLEGPDLPVGLELRPPGRDWQSWAQGALAAGTYHELADGGTVLARVYVENDPPAPLAGVPPRRRITVAVRHTARCRNAMGCKLGGRPDLAGDWAVRLVAADAASDRLVELWIARDEPIFRLRTGGRQSFFPLQRGDADRAVVTDGTLSDLASGERTVVLAALRGSDLAPARYSSEGALAANTMAGRDVLPTAAAVADDGAALTGVLTAGFFSGSTVRLSGTSVASPLALRRILLEGLGKGGPRAAVSALAGTEEAARPPPPLPVEIAKTKVFRRRVGAGRLDDRRGRTGRPHRP